MATLDELALGIATTWSVMAMQDNALATATEAAVPDTSHFLAGVAAGFSAAAAGKLLQIKDGTTVILNLHVHNQREVIFDPPLKITAGNAVSAELAASGTGGVIGSVNAWGYTYG